MSCFKQYWYLFWATPTFLCQRRHCLVGANILPPRHMLPKAAWPDLGGASGDRKLDRFDNISILGTGQVCRRYDQESTTVFSSEQFAIGEQAAKPQTCECRLPGLEGFSLQRVRFPRTRHLSRGRSLNNLLIISALGTCLGIDLSKSLF